MHANDILIARAIRKKVLMVEQHKNGANEKYWGIYDDDGLIEVVSSESEAISIIDSVKEKIDAFLKENM